MSDAKDIAARAAQLVAERETEAGTGQLAAVYAKALLGASEQAGLTEAVVAEFGGLVADVLEPFPRLEAVLASALVRHEEKTALLDRLLAGKVSPLLLNFLKIVSRRGRLDCLRAIYRQTRLQFDVLRGRVAVQLVTAVPVSAEILASVTDALRAALGGEPVLQQVVEPGVIGGAVVRVGDTVYDATIATQLQNLRQQMIDRSVHEIQSRRDRFRYPA
jgi:F-type H+-transporting ATPase subunit delta